MSPWLPQWNQWPRTHRNSAEGEKFGTMMCHKYQGDERDRMFLQHKKRTLSMPFDR
jgi:hypothetical protein